MKLKDFDEIIDTIAATPHCDFVKALLIMNNAPTVDAVPVVRCRDCIHAIKNSYEVCFCDVHEDYCVTNDYCSYGKRMDGGDEDAER